MSTSNDIILQNFFDRRKIFDDYIKEKKLNLYTCPSCGYSILEERGGFEICSICDWEDDGQDDEEADEVWGGPNGKLSLTDSRIQIGLKLSEMEKYIQKKLDLDPEKVTNRLGIRGLKIEAFANTIPMDADISSQIYTDYASLKENSLVDLFV